MNYKEINDYELIYEVRERNEDSYNLLIKKYSTLIRRIADEYYRKCKRFKIEYDDLVQEGYYGLFQALDNYDEETSLFYTFASLCIKREMERLIKSYSRNKHMILNDAISMNEPIDEDNDTFLEDTIPSNYNVEEDIISDMNISNILKIDINMCILIFLLVYMQ